MKWYYVGKGELVAFGALGLFLLWMFFCITAIIVQGNLQ